MSRDQKLHIGRKVITQAGRDATVLLLRMMMLAGEKSWSFISVPPSTSILLLTKCTLLFLLLNSEFVEHRRNGKYYHDHDDDDDKHQSKLQQHQHDLRVFIGLQWGEKVMFYLFRNANKSRRETRQVVNG